jgi:calcineurin-like phosphoesterase family protein
MDKKITELDSIEKLDGHEYFVVASDKYDENYKLNVSDFVEQLDLVEVDKELSLLSTNPVQNKTITQKINEIDDVLEDLDNRVSNWEGDDEHVDFDISIKNV